MAVYAVQDKKTIAHLFDGWDEAVIWSCLQDYMGLGYTDDLASPRSAQISLGDFCFFAGSANDDLIRHRPENLHSNFAILVPQNREWEAAIDRCYKESATRRMRYATKKHCRAFDKAKLQHIVTKLSLQYALKLIDSPLYKEILSLDWAKDFCRNYASYEEFQSYGLGIVILKDEFIVSGASSYASFRDGIEIEIITREDERRKGLASACGAALILECLSRNWYPSWDAHNKGSLALAEKLGYHFDKEYSAYEIYY